MVWPLCRSIPIDMSFPTMFQLKITYIYATSHLYFRIYTSMKQTASQYDCLLFARTLLVARLIYVCTTIIQ